MGIFFGTDGIRGVVNEDLTSVVAYKCGNALGSSKNMPTILIHLIIRFFFTKSFFLFKNFYNFYKLLVKILFLNLF